ncbi:MAG TPA: T9SS type A sorting domain-containing protein, partial [Candidatus Kapabacteria bacterium]|nr:T9SS type A sorting domain-containing protein [Candidatus Kapabacteria bacterium]
SESLLGSTQNNPEWRLVGPLGSPLGNMSGNGRLNGVTLSSNNENLIWVAAAGGGAWKSTDAGKSWTTTTDKIAVLAINDVALDPKNDNIVYLGTGDDWGQGAIYRNVNSAGVMKSTDGGNTWQETGLKWNIAQGITISKILVHPQNSSILLATTTDGIYRSTDAAATWTRVQTGWFRDLDFHKEDPDRWYACSNTQFFLSTDGGVKWSSKTVSGMSGTRRLAISSSEANSDFIYLVAANGDGRFAGLFHSTDGGDTWTRRSTTPSILEDNIDGTVNTGRQGQGWYDLAILASPTDAKSVFVGGINIWRSATNGQTWTIVSDWLGRSGKSYVHADIHDIDYSSVSGKIYAATDGGLYVTTNNGTTWTEINGTKAIMQFYKISITEQSNIILGGSQDNGTNRFSSNEWREANGGDGMDNGIDPTNSQIMYCSNPQGDLRKSSNGGQNFGPMLTDNTTGESGQWVTPFVIDMAKPDNLYAGYRRVWKSTDKGSTWRATGNFPNNPSALVNCIAVSESNNSWIYASSGAGLFYTTDAGVTWAQRTGLPFGAGNISSIAISKQNHQRVCVTLSRFGAANVYESLNGGETWKDVSAGMPRVPANTCIYEKSNNRIFVGTDIGVYYKDEVAGSFNDYNNGFPAVFVNDLEISNSRGKLIVGTWGRGVWEANLPACQGGVLSISIKGDTSFCEGKSVVLEAQPGYASYSWSNGEQGQSITITKSGNYSVAALDDKGCPFGSRSVKVSVTEVPDMSVSVTPNSTTTSPVANVFCGVDSVRIRATTGFDTWEWSNGLNERSGVFKSTAKLTVKGTTSEGCIKESDTIFVYVIPGDSLELAPQDKEVFTTPLQGMYYQWLQDGQAMPGQTAPTFKGGPQYNKKKISVRITTFTGCVVTSSVQEFTADGTDVVESNDGTSVTIMPNPATNDIYIQSECDGARTLNATLYNTLGIQVRTMSFEHNGDTKTTLSVNGLPAGHYVMHIEGCGMTKVLKVIIQ